LVNINSVDCDVLYTDSGKGFTPISTTFCPEGSVNDILTVVSSIRAITSGKNISYVYDKNSYHENASHPFIDNLSDLCHSIIECSGSGDQVKCVHFENDVKNVIESNLNDEHRDHILSVYPTAGAISAKIVTPRKSDPVWPVAMIYTAVGIFFFGVIWCYRRRFTASKSFAASNPLSSKDDGAKSLELDAA